MTLKLLKNYNEKEVSVLEKKVDEILSLAERFKRLSNDEIYVKSLELKNRILNGSSIEDILVEGFALCKEVIHRELGKQLYKVQLIGGVALYQGRIIEMKTGEGKTLTEICPAYINALEGKGVHVITVNDYLAQRDKETVERVFERLGISIGLILNNDNQTSRKEAYEKDITYTTNIELGFDYLRDTLVRNSFEKVQRNLNYVIIDEVDSILIDEAKTPLILSSGVEVDINLLKTISCFAKSLNNSEYEISIIDRTVSLTVEGIRKLEVFFCIDNIANEKYSEINHMVKQSLIAEFLYLKDKEYIVKDKKIILIDMHTGRIAEGRKLSNGLHQCIELKEDVDITSDTNTVASITYQNFFRLYTKLSGMSGTVLTEELEFKGFYNTDVIEIPLNRKKSRQDLSDVICKNEEEKLSLILDDILKINRVKRPILIVMSSVGKAERISLFLNNKGIKHNLLTAKSNEEEAKIIAMAGYKSAITVSTNIAGRGTDIKISDEVNKIGGLKVIGVEHNFSKRIDNQLIGRAGRQGDNGESQFYVSIEDDLFKLCIEEEQLEYYKAKKRSCNKYLEKLVKKAQLYAEDKGFEERKELIKYGEILNKHRKLILDERNKVLENFDLRDYVSNCIVASIAKIVEERVNDSKLDEISELQLNEIFDLIEIDIQKRFYYKCRLQKSLKNKEEIINLYIRDIINYYNEIASKVSYDLLDNIKEILLCEVDSAWVYHMEELESLKRDCYVQAYVQKDPLGIYKLKSKEKYDFLIKRIKKNFICKVFEKILEIDKL